MDYNWVDNILQKALSDSGSDLDLKVMLDKKLDEYSLSKTKVRNLLNIEHDTFEDIINGTSKQPSLINILKIAEFLEISEMEAIAATLRNVDKTYIYAIQKAKEATIIAKYFDIRKLKKIGFFEDAENIDVITNRILSFFGCDNIMEFGKETELPLYAKTKKILFSDKMKYFWIRAAHKCFTEINNQQEYDRQALKDLIINMRPYCQDVENGLLTVCKALYNVGVTVIVQNQLTGTQIMGATLIVNDKPCIVLTDFNKRYTIFWHVLIHELHHVLHDLDKIKSSSFHLSGEADLFLIEDKANYFSREYFFGIDKYHFIKPHINNPYIVKKFAKENEIHESFIYSAFRHYEKELNGKNYYGAYAEFFPDHELAINKLSPITWKANSLPEIAKKLKTIFELNSV